ncbi:Aldo/keto reductase [Gymnopus androsaceus JB14]|uniref:Aldo/keto reductase n=1 Tax=Gymnopus androsaceus JB14 TaxID=1447944 RepID=A0A6A4GRZ3_9AGAR|nr:Aldo/keto reductase [Gymnopus androsaceus JB14]
MSIPEFTLDSISSTVKLSSGHDMPILGFGVFRNYDAKPACIAAFKAGYRHIDSAQTYRNEDAVGEAVRESGLERSDVFITTKCVSGDHGYDLTLRGVDWSLQQFGFDYIDLFLIHDPMSGTEKRLATYKALLECKVAGKIRTVGVSNYNVKHLEEIHIAGYEMPAVNQIELHPICQQKSIVEYCEKHSIIVQAYCPIVFASIAAKHRREPAANFIRWSLQKGYIPLPKSATPSRIHSNAQIFDFELDTDDMIRLDALNRGKAGAVSWNPVDAD